MMLEIPGCDEELWGIVDELSFREANPELRESWSSSCRKGFDCVRGIQAMRG